MRIRWWTNARRNDVVHTQSKVLLAVEKAMNGAGIDMPFPTQVHLFHDQTEELDGRRDRQREGWPGAGREVPRSRIEVEREDEERHAAE